MFIELFLTSFFVTILCGLIWFFSRLDSDVTVYYADKWGHKIDKLTGKVIWITGASSGIGEALANKLAGVGAKLILSGTNEYKLEEVKNKCINTGKLKSEDILCLPFDMTDTDLHAKQFKKVIDHFNQLDILVNNAGRSQRAEFKTTSLEVDKELFQINVFSVVSLTRLAVNYWFENNIEGHLVVTSSLAGKMGNNIGASYAASKHAIHGYFESIRLEFEGRIKVTLSCPGPTLTQSVTRAFTNVPGESHGTIHGPQSQRMTASRCAHLTAVAIANDIDETWIVRQPILMMMYAYQYAPSITRWLSPIILSKERRNKYREGK